MLVQCDRNVHSLTFPSQLLNLRPSSCLYLLTINAPIVDEAAFINQYWENASGMLSILVQFVTFFPNLKLVALQLAAVW